MTGRKVAPGPGTVRVARFIGRLGVVSLPAVEVGLDLDERVVRRHVAKLEAAGWLARMPWTWGEGSVAWLTGLGIERVGLGGVRAVKAPPSPTVIHHALLVQWSVARAERRGKTWLSSRELAVERERWAVTIRCERGYTRQLPDLAVWVGASGAPYAVIGETGRRREDRQKMILEGWRDAVTAGRYAGVRFDCASASAALLIRRLAKKVSLASLDFSALVQTTAPEIIELARADAEGLARAAAEPYEPTTGTVDGSAAGVQPAVEQVPVAQPFPPSVAAGEVQRVVKAAPVAQPPLDDADLERRLRGVLGIPEPKSRRRWRR